MKIDRALAILVLLVFPFTLNAQNRPAPGTGEVKEYKDTESPNPLEEAAPLDPRALPEGHIRVWNLSKNPRSVAVFVAGQGGQHTENNSLWLARKLGASDGRNYVTAPAGNIELIAVDEYRESFGPLPEGTESAFKPEQQLLSQPSVTLANGEWITVLLRDAADGSGRFSKEVISDNKIKTKRGIRAIPLVENIKGRVLFLQNGIRTPLWRFGDFDPFEAKELPGASRFVDIEIEYLNPAGRPATLSYQIDTALGRSTTLLLTKNRYNKLTLAALVDVPKE